MGRTVLLAGGDLMGRGRFEAAAGAAGLEVHHCRVGGLAAALQEVRPDVLVLDLDAGRGPLLDELVSARDAGLAPAAVVGYYSHVDVALGRAAEAAGCTPYARGRFWRDLPDLLGA